MTSDLKIIEKAEMLIRESKLEEAENTLISLLNSPLAPKGRIYFDLGNIDYLNGEKECCRDWYDKAILEGYINYNLLMNYSKIEKEEGNVESSIKLLKQACELNRENLLTYMTLAGTYLEIGDYKNAVKVADNLIHEKPTQYDGYHLKALILLEDDAEVEHCIELLKSIKALFSLHDRYIYDMANAYYKSSDYNQALNVINYYIDACHDDVSQEILALKIRSLIAMGEYAEVESIIRELAYKFDNHKAKAALAFLLIWNNNENEAEQVLKELTDSETNPYEYLLATIINRFIYYKHLNYNAIDMNDVIQKVSDEMVTSEEGHKYLPLLSIAYVMSGNSNKADEMLKKLMAEYNSLYA